MTSRVEDVDRGRRRVKGADVLVVGAGLIGLAAALELHLRGAVVTVVERGSALTGASTAAAGMLAVDDPHNPAAVHAFSQWSAELYQDFLQRIEHLSGVTVPFQTERTVQYMPDGSQRLLMERSVDPRQLAGAVLASVRATPIRLVEHAWITNERMADGRFELETNFGQTFAADNIVYAAGAWTSEAMAHVPGGVVPVAPRKGQMLRVRLPATLVMEQVYRDEDVYIVPRTSGPQAGTALIGATVEDAGFETAVRREAMADLRARACKLIPALADESDAPQVEAWAGLRPVTPDSLPVLGAFGDPGRFVASGHYRNGVLQAPATAMTVADLIEGRPVAVDLTAFDPRRFWRCGDDGRAPNSGTDIRPIHDDKGSLPL